MLAPAAQEELDPPPAGGAGAAFDLAGGPDAVLLLHGLTGSPFELRHLATRLAERGLRCRGPLLPGHGGDPRRLTGVPWRAWLDAARQEFGELGGARRRYLVGCSMGALLACALAHELPGEVDGLALLAPALRLWPAGRLAGLLGRLGPVARLPPVPKRPGGDVRDEQMRRVNPNMPAIPLAAVSQLVDLAAHVDRLLPAISVPALVLAGGQDHTVRLSGVRRLARRLGGGGRLLVLERSYHLIGIDVDRERCADEVARFFGDVGAEHGWSTD